MSDRDTLATILSLVRDELDYAKPDYLDAKAPAASVQLLFGTRITVPYLDGGGEGELPFAVLLRVPTVDSATRVDAAVTLSEVAYALDGYSGGDISNIRAESTPVKEFADETSEVWRIQFTAEVEREAQEMS
jgi:hypothetical protein